MSRKRPLLLSRRSVFARCEVAHRFWHGACIEEMKTEILFKTLWRNPELHGVWECSYRITPQCMMLLLDSRQFVLVSSNARKRVYRLRD